MINDRNNRNMRNDRKKRYNPFKLRKDNNSKDSRQKSDYYSKKLNNKKFNNDIKVVSTNIIKEDLKKNVEKRAKIDKKNIFEHKDKNFRNNFKNFRDAKKNIERPKSINTKRISIYKVNFLKRENCVICNRLIIDMPSSISDTINNKYYHFDCVMKDIKKDNIIKQSQRLVYAGNGAFAIIEDSVKDGRKKFEIIKNIQYIKK